MTSRISSLALSLTIAASTFAPLVARAADAPSTPQIAFPAPSPAATLKQRIGLTDFEVVYSRPGMKGREIFGSLLAWGQVWRTGANNATRITFSTPVKLEGTSFEAGTYELFTIPGSDEWIVILQKAGKQWGAYAYKQENDVARLKVKPVKLPTAVETFTIEFDDIRDETATLNFVWEKTRVPVKLEVDVASALVPQIEAVLAAGTKLSNGQNFNAAQFYYDHGRDLKKALTMITAATDNNNPAFYMMHLKAKILAKLGEKDAAKAAANKSIELAVAAEGPKSPFVKMNNDLIAGLK